MKDRQLEVKDQQIAELQATIKQMREQFDSLQNERGQSQSAPAAAAWWQSPWVMGSGMGAVALLLGWGLFAARRRRAVANEAYYEQPELAAEPVHAEPSVTAVSAAAVADDADTLQDTEWADDEVAEPIEETSTVDLLDDEEIDEDEAMGQTGDVIGEADIYIAYGRYPQAISLLGGALEADADRHDVRVKLLELYAETNDAEAFESELKVLQDRCEDQEYLEIAAQFKERLDDATLDLDDLDAEDEATPATTEAEATTELDDEFELEIDESVLGDAETADEDTTDAADAAADLDRMLDDISDVDQADDETAGFEEDAVGFDQDAAGFDSDAAGFDQDAAGFTKDAAGAIAEDLDSDLDSLFDDLDAGLADDATDATAAPVDNTEALGGESRYGLRSRSGRSRRSDRVERQRRGGRPRRRRIRFQRHVGQRQHQARSGACLHRHGRRRRRTGHSR